MSYNVVFCGTPDICLPTLEALHKHSDINLKYVISMPDRPKGRGMKMQSPEVAQFAKDNGIELMQTANINKEEEFLEKLKNEDIHFFVVFAFAQFLSQKILDLPSIACFNIHTSILPKYRGAAPIQYAILNGDTTTGVSIQKMVKKMDAGDIAHFDEVEIGKDETGGDLYNKLKTKSGESINALIEKLKNNSLSYTQQDESNVSFAPTLKKEEGNLLFSENNFEDLRNRVRALQPWPGTYTMLNGKRLKVFEVEEATIGSIGAGEVSTKQGFLLVGTKDKTMRLKSIQLEGKKRCLDTDLLNGLRDNITIG